MRNINIKQILIYGLMVVGLSILTVGIFFASDFERQLSYKIENYKENVVEPKFYSIVELYGMYDNQKFSSFAAEKDALERQKKMNEDINNTFNYIEVYEQPIAFIEYFKYDPKFCHGYETGQVETFINQKLDTEEFGKIYWTPLKTLELGINANSRFSMESQVESGRSFCDKDFKYENGQKIPIILGHRYSGIYAVGDTFTADYLASPFDFEVIGFYKKGTYVPVGNLEMMVDLDYYIVIPYVDFDLPTNPVIERLQIDHYSMKNTGYLCVDKDQDFAAVQDTFSKLAKKNGLLYQLRDTDYQESSIQNSEYAVMKQMKTTILIIAVLVQAVLAAIVTLLILKRFSDNRKQYAIHLICGASLSSIKRKGIWPLFAVFSGSFLLGLVETIMILGNMGLDLGYAMSIAPRIAGVYGIYLLVVSLAAARYMDKCNFGFALRL